jgi:hypothetical protein
MIGNAFGVVWFPRSVWERVAISDTITRMATTAVQPTTSRTRTRTQRPLLVLALVGAVFLTAAVATLVALLAAAYREYRGHAALARFEAVVVTGQLKPQNPAAGWTQPWNTEFRPELLVRYSLDGEEVENWIEAAPDLPTMDVWEAWQRLDAFDPGDRLTLCVDADDPTALRIDPGSRWRRSALLGGIVSLFIAMPGLGLILAAWLLRRHLARTAS